MEQTGTERLRNAIDYYSKAEWKILPCHGIVDGRCTCRRKHGEPKEVGKHPVINQWNAESTSDIATINKWWSEDPDYNVGVHCSKSGFLVIDIDPRSDGPASFVEFEKIADGALPKTIEAHTGTYTGLGGIAERGRHIFYRCSPDESLIGNLGALGLKGIDIKHNGYVLVAPSRHFSGVTYEWVEGHAPWEVEIAEAPEALLEILRKRAKRSGTLSPGNWEEFDYKRIDLPEMFKAGIHEGSRNNDLYKFTIAVSNRFPSIGEVEREMIEATVVKFNQLSVHPPLEMPELVTVIHRGIEFVINNPKWVSNYSTAELGTWASSAAERAQAEATAEKAAKNDVPLLGVVSPGGRVSVASVEKDYAPFEENIASEEDSISNAVAKMQRKNIQESVANGASILEASSPTNTNSPKDTDAVDENDGGIIGLRSCTDVGNGRRLVDNFGSGIRYTSGLGWFVWKNGFWKPDREDLEISELAKRLAGIISGESQLGDESRKGEIIKWASQTRSNSRITGAIESGKSDPRISIPVEEWDKDDNLLGVLNGVINLKTGELLKGRPDLHITKRAPVSFTRGHTNTRWEKFLDEATLGDKQFQRWLQRAAGYTLTGSNKYDIMFMVYGPPGSGKNTFVEAIVKCLGTQQYSWPLDSTILAQGDGMSHSTDLYHWAQLRGRRMVWVDELPESERIKENAVKKLTGSSEISARSPGESPFTFESKAKLWVSTNNRPIITDDAMWRRIRPVPFEHKPAVPDPGLKEFIFDPEGGLPAVLAWAVEGAIEINNSREIDALGWCDVVSSAAEIYRKNEDRIGLFLEEETEEVAGEEVPIEKAYQRYRMWADKRGERPFSQTNFQRKLAEKSISTKGVGSRAFITNRILISRAASSSLDFKELFNNASH